MKKLNATEKQVKESIAYALKQGKKQVVLRCVDALGSGRNSRYSVDRTDKYLNACNSFGLNAWSDNDAKQGGQLGNIVVIKIDKRKAFIKELMKELESEKAVKQVKQVRPVGALASAFKEVSKEEVNDLINFWKESSNILTIRKKLGLKLRDVRQAFINEVA